jgi:hypothetical protein
VQIPSAHLTVDSGRVTLGEQHPGSASTFVELFADVGEVADEVFVLTATSGWQRWRAIGRLIVDKVRSTERLTDDFVAVQGDPATTTYALPPDLADAIITDGPGGVHVISRTAAAVTVEAVDTTSVVDQEFLFQAETPSQVVTFVGRLRVVELRLRDLGMLSAEEGEPKEWSFSFEGASGVLVRPRPIGDDDVCAAARSR